MNRNRWTSLLVLLAPLGLAAWFLLPDSTRRTYPKPVPAVLPAPADRAPLRADSDDDLVASRAAIVPYQRRG